MRLLEGFKRIVGRSPSLPGFACYIKEDLDEITRKDWRKACEGLPFYAEHEGKQYCILHFPGEEKSKDFESAYEKKLRDQNCNFGGVYFPHGFNFRDGHTFTKEAHFEGARFAGEAHFDNATFTKKAIFRYAVFEEGANFRDTCFEEEADFFEATFEGAANFIKCVFPKGAFFGPHRDLPDDR